MRSKTLDFSALAVCLGLLFAPCTILVQAKTVAESAVVAPIDGGRNDRGCAGLRG